MSLEDYEPVAVRLSRLLATLRARDIDPRIITVMLSEPGSDVCVFRAELWIGDQLMATGHAEEVRDTSGKRTVNASSHVENCETSSLGRLCESYAPTSDHTKRPSREEMQKVQRVSGNTTITESGDLASDKQRNMIRAVCKSLGKTPPVNLDGFTKRQASAYIDELKRLEAGEQPAPSDDNYAPEEPF
jgi:hypothetical protein